MEEIIIYIYIIYIIYVFLLSFVTFKMPHQIENKLVKDGYLGIIDWLKVSVLFRITFWPMKSSRGKMSGWNCMGKVCSRWCLFLFLHLSSRVSHEHSEILRLQLWPTLVKGGQHKWLESSWAHWPKDYALTTQTELTFMFRNMHPNDRFLTKTPNPQHAYPLTNFLQFHCIRQEK